MWFAIPGAALTVRLQSADEKGVLVEAAGQGARPRQTQGSVDGVNVSGLPGGAFAGELTVAANPDQAFVVGVTVACIQRPAAFDLVGSALFGLGRGRREERERGEGNENGFRSRIGT
jgi:hypothetical protein